jgi:hypothetical protein
MSLNKSTASIILIQSTANIILTYCTVRIIIISRTAGIQNSSEDHYRPQLDHTYKWILSWLTIILWKCVTISNILVLLWFKTNCLIIFLTSYQNVINVYSFYVYWTHSICYTNYFATLLLIHHYIMYKYNMTVWYTFPHEYDRKKIDRIWKGANIIIYNETLVLPSNLYKNMEH